MKNIDSDLIRGNIDTIILKTMIDGDKYGLDIIKEVDERSNGTYELKQPTLYSCLKRLENQGLISSYWLDSEIGGRRHYYKLTEAGHESLRKKQEEWAKSKFIIDNLLSNYNYDEYRLVKKDDYDKIIEGKQFEYTPEDKNEKTLNSPSEPDENEILTTNQTEIEDNAEDTQEVEEIEDAQINDETFEEQESTSIQNKTEIRDESADDAENKKYGGYKFSSVYDSINIEGYDTTPIEDDNNAFETELNSEEEVDEDDDFINEINEYTSLLDYDEDEELEDELQDEDLDEDEELEDELQDEELDDQEELEDEHVYISQEATEEIANETNDVSYELADQTQNEQNILAKLRMQQDEKINEYVGDKHSYINHLNQEDEDAIQQNLLFDEDLSNNDTVDDKINDFANAISELNKFATSSKSVEEEFENQTEIPSENEETEELEEFEEHIENEPAYEQSSFDDDFLAELNELKNNQTNGFFGSTDSAEYDEDPIMQSELDIPDFAENSNCGCDSNDLDNFTFTSEHAEVTFNGHEEDDDDYQREFSHKEINFEDVETEQASFNSFDEIISRNVSDYTNDNETLISSEEFKSQTTLNPSYTGGNYKQKLSNLSAYSKITTEEKANETKEPSAETLTKVKDISALTAEFENEGIKVKEYKKHGAQDEAEKNYLLVNKLNLVKSLILLFAYVFVLSSVYVIMHSTSGKNILDFSFKYFVFGMIPFIVYAGYYTVLYVINPYRKVTAKYAPRIMIFIAIIITVQLLLITYCVNLQLGFYSFTQQFYNHLLWIVPTIVSFAPIIVTIIHISLFYSKNFNV